MGRDVAIRRLAVAATLSSIGSGAPAIALSAHVYRLSAEGSIVRLVPIHDPTLNLGPEMWSPDGSPLAFEGWDDGDSTRDGVYAARIDGSDLVRVTRSPLPNDIPMDFSTGGSRILFRRREPGEDAVGPLFAVSVDGSDLRRLTPSGIEAAGTARCEVACSRSVSRNLRPTRS